MKKRVSCFLMAVCLLACTLFSYTNVLTVEAAPQTVTVNPVKVDDVNNILPDPTYHYPAGDDNTYSYLFKFTLDEAAEVRITGLSRYTFWNWNGDTSYKLTDALVDSKATVNETWSTSVNADHTWEEQAGNYCDEVFTLNKGTYYLFVNTNLAKNWKNESYQNYKPTDFDLGFWLSINVSSYVKAPVLKACRNTAAKKLVVQYSKSKNATGYNIAYSTSKKFKTSRTVNSKKAKVTLKKLKKKTYYVRVRAYKLESGKKYYSAWSNVKKVKIRK